MPVIYRIPIDWGHHEIPGTRKIDTIVIHTIYDNTAEGEMRFDTFGIINRLKQHLGGVAAHYIIARSGDLIQLVDDDDVAYHTGESELPQEPGSGKVNLRSIGIEIANAKDTRPTDAQYDAMSRLVSYKLACYPIKYIVGHDAIALPIGRKDDPWNFDWQRFLDSLT